MTLDESVHIASIKMNTTAVFDERDLPGPEHFADGAHGPSQVARCFRNVIKPLWQVIFNRCIIVERCHLDCQYPQCPWNKWLPERTVTQCDGVAIA